MIDKKFYFLLIVCCMAVTGMYAGAVFAVTKTPILSGLHAGVGVAIDESNNHLYFVEYNSPDLKRVALTPECENDPTVACVVVSVTTGFVHAEDVALDIDHGFAYVTTRDNPGTGGLWRVDLATNTKTLVTFNLGAPQQLVLDIPNNQAYVVGYNDNRLRRIDLSTGAKVPVFTALQDPVGLAVTSDHAYAYVTEQRAPARISKIDLLAGIKVEDVVTHGVGGADLVSPFFLAWVDAGQSSLYVAEREPANRISKLDLVGAPNLYSITTGIVMPWRPTGLIARSTSSPLFVTAENELIKLDLIALSGPIFRGVGHVPASAIVNGYANTADEIPGYPHPYRHAPFGGTMDIFGDLAGFVALGAKYYAVQVDKGGLLSYLTGRWTTAKWDSVALKYKPFPIAPALDGYKYEIPVESDGLYHHNLWYEDDWMMRWPSGENGLHELSIKLYNASGGDITASLSSLPAPNSLKLLIDNTPLAKDSVKINAIWQKGNPTAIKPCEIITGGNNKFYFNITANDPNHHLLSYYLEALWGNNKSEVLDGYRDNYNNHINPVLPHAWDGVFNHIPLDSTSNPITWTAKCNCAHTFYLRAWKRTTNGERYIFHRRYHRSVTIMNTPHSCGNAWCGFPCP